MITSQEGAIRFPALSFEFTDMFHTSDEDVTSATATPDNLSEWLREMVSDISPAPEEMYEPAATLREDLAMDSLDMVELIMNCEKQFYITIPDREWHGVKTVGDLENLLRQRVGR